jgi:serine/threonine-protein kinase
VTLGRAGTVLGAAILLEGTGGAPGPATSGLTELGNQVLSGIWRELDAMPPISQGGRLDRLGVAHGWAGLLLTTLRWSRVTGNTLPERLPERLDQLAELAIAKGLGARWSWIHDPRHPGSGKSMPGWCNGTAGFVHLWTMAHTALRDERWAVLAEKAAWDTYTTQTNIAQLCCGSAGQAYALLDMYRHSGESRWLTAAYELGARAAASAGGPAGSTLIPGSLHKGDVGIAVLAADLADPEAAVMPFFGSEL